MRSIAFRVPGLVFAASLSCLIAGSAQEQSPGSDPTDPRAKLKAGFRDAGEVARNMKLVESLPKPEGFFDPDVPAGEPTPPERDPEEEKKEKEKEKEKKEASDAKAPSAPKTSGFLNFANSDLAFSKDRLFVGNFNGFNLYNIEDPVAPQLTVSVVCPGGQGDVSVYGNLLFMSVEQTRGRVDCGIAGRFRAGERRAFPGQSASSTSATCGCPSRWPRCRPAGDRTRTRS